MLEILDKVCTPTKGSKFSAAIDLYARENVVIGAGETALIPLGVKIDKNKMPIYLQNNKHRHYLQLEPRSSLRAKGLIAGTGIIDVDYEDEIMIILHNPIKDFFINEDDDINDVSGLDKRGCDNNPAYIIKKGDKIAQIMIKEHKTYLFGIETEQERSGGFGSSGL